MMRIRLVLLTSLVMIVMLAVMAVPAAAQDSAPGPITVGPWELTLKYTHTTNQFKSGYYPNETTYTADPGYVFLELLIEVRLTDSSQTTTLKDSEFEMVVVDASGAEFELQGTGSNFNNYCMFGGCQSEFYFDNTTASNIIYVFTVSSETTDPNYTLKIAPDVSVPFTVPYVDLFDVQAASETITPITRADYVPITLDNAGSLALQSSLAAHDSYLDDVIVSADGSRVVSTGCDLYGKSGCLGYAVRTWDIDNSQITTTITIGDISYGGSGEVWGVSLSPGGSVAGGTDWESKVHLWDLVTGDPLDVTVGGESARDLIFAPDGVHLAVCAANDPITLWDVTTGEAGVTLAGPCNAGTFSLDGQWLAVFGGDPQYGIGDGLIHVWDTVSGQAGPVIGEPGASVMQWNLAFNPDHTLLASASPSSFNADGLIHLWNTTDGTEQAVCVQSGTSKAVLSLAFSPDGSLLVSGDDSGAIHLWDVSTQQEIATLNVADAGSISALAFTADGTLLVVGHGGMIELWGVPAAP